MQLETPLPFRASRNAAQPVRVSLELIAYLALAVFALVLGLAELDSTPITPGETHNALAAWRAITPDASGTPLIATSPILFAVQATSFSLFGASELTVRIGTVFAGIALMLSPILFRSLLGSARAFLLSLLLAFSPVLLASARSSSADVWALLFAVISLWGLWQATRYYRFGMVAVIAFAALALLTSSGGLVLALILAVALGLTAFWRRSALALDEDDLAEARLDAMRGTLRLALPAAGLVVLMVSTGLMLYPAGLSAVGEVVSGVARAVVQPSGAGGYAALVALFYEPGLWLFAAAGLLLRRDRLTTFDIFLLAWVVLGVVASLIFADGVPSRALWITVPLAGLAVNAVARLFVPDEDITFMAAPNWARWVIGASLIGVLLVFTLAFQSLARSMLQTPEGALTALAPEPDSIVLILVSVLFMLIGFFLFASLWGNRTSWQGIGLGVGIFLLITSLGSGWNASVSQSQNPAEFWHSQATHGNTTLLRRTLFEVSERLSGAFPAMPVAAVAPQDGIVAWLLRDYVNAEYLSDPNDALGAEVAILPATFESPQFEQGYVGQDFVITRSWAAATMAAIDFPALWTQRQARLGWTGEDRVVLWLRADVYSGVDPAAEVG